jgi:hypothetical protein
MDAHFSSTGVRRRQLPNTDQLVPGRPPAPSQAMTAALRLGGVGSERIVAAALPRGADTGSTTRPDRSARQDRTWATSTVEPTHGRR